VHCSLWRFEGDPDDLEQRYLAVMAEVPETNHVLHAAAKTPNGLLVFDTCPSQGAYREFFEGPARALFEKHGLAPTASEDYPVIRAYGARSRLDDASSWTPHVLALGVAREAVIYRPSALSGSRFTLRREPAAD
jgi:hypothetical protein